MSKEREMLVKIYRFLKSNIEDDFAPDSDVRVLAGHIRELLTHPKQDLREEQEPVAWMCNLMGHVVICKPNANNGDKPLYTAPPKRMPLSAEEIKQTTKNMSEFAADMFKAGIKAAERAHGIGE